MSDSSSSVNVDCIKKKKKRAYDYNADFDSLTVPDMLSFYFYFI